MTDENAPPTQIAEALEALRGTARIEGAAVIDASGGGLVYQAGLGAATILKPALRLLERETNLPSHAVTPDGRPILVCPWAIAPRRLGGLALWRMPGSRVWTQADYVFVASLACLVKVMLAQDMAQSGMDQLTGLPGRARFLEEANRHIDRLQKDRQHGCLLLADLDGLKRINAAHGRAAGDRSLLRVADLLRASIRPADVMGRVGPDEFAVWMTGMDHMTTAERADEMTRPRAAEPDDGPEHTQTLSIGIARRAPDDGLDAASLLERARVAIDSVKWDGGAGWRVYGVKPPVR